MQELASHLAMFQDTSVILDAIPSAYISSAGWGTDVVLEETMKKHLNSYEKARKILDIFWLDDCYNTVVLKDTGDTMLEILAQRVLLMDQEIREENKHCFIYPDLDFRSPKRILDDQLFFLQTSLLIALSGDQQNLIDSKALEHTIELVQLRLKPAQYGTDKKRHKPYEFFLPNLVEGVRKIQEIMKVVDVKNSSTNSLFQSLHKLLIEYHLPDKREIETELEKAFKELKSESPLLSFDSSIDDLINIVRAIKSEMKTLLDSSNSNSNNIFSFKKLQDDLGKVSKIIEHNKFGENTSTIDLSQILENFAKSEEKIKETIRNQIDNNIKKSINQLNYLTKNLSSLDQIETDKVKKLQQEIQNYITSVSGFLKTPKQPSALDFSVFKEKSLSILNDIFKDLPEKSVAKLPNFIEKLNQTKVDSVEIILEVQGLINEINIFLSGKKNKQLASRFNSSINVLSNIVEPWLAELLRPSLESLLSPLKDCQKALDGVYLKKLRQMNEQLCLGIREQTYYTTDNKNVTYYLWDGKPFNALPYHTDNEVHLPLVQDDNWAGVQKDLWRRDFFKDQWEAQDELDGLENENREEWSFSVTRIRDNMDSALTSQVSEDIT